MSISYGADSRRDGVGINQEKKDSHIVKSTEIGMLEPLECIFKPADKYPITKIKLPYLKIPSIAEPFNVKKFDISLEIGGVEAFIKKPSSDEFNPANSNYDDEKQLKEKQDSSEIEK